MLIVAQNKLLLSKNQNTIKIQEIILFQGDLDYLATNIYLSVSNFSHQLNGYEKLLTKHVVWHARKVVFIKDHHIFSLNFTADICSEIQEHSQQKTSINNNLD